jgi:hypothetical protein
MSENVHADPAPVAEATAEQFPQCESPPPAPQPARDETPDPRGQLLQLAQKVMRSPNRRLVIEYLRLRRAIA